MADYGVLSAIRKLIASDEGIIESGLDEKVHLAIPPKSELPLVLLELEEIWTSLKLGMDSGHARLKLKASILSNQPTGRESITVADNIRQVMDGQTLEVDQNMRATIRLANSVIDLPLKTGPRMVQQFYEVLVRS
ncbi:MAG: hypothetical protein HEEMFOPI_01014 [Holosporales bacterium]